MFPNKIGQARHNNGGNAYCPSTIQIKNERTAALHQFVMGRNLDARRRGGIPDASHPIRRWLGQLFESGDIMSATWEELNIFGF